MTDNTEKITLWRDRLTASNKAYDGELLKMDDRELLYKGDKKIIPLSTRNKTVLYTSHVRNVVAEMIESQIDTTIPQPVVTSPYRHNEELATLIENKLRCEVNRLPSELINDMLSRTVPVQGCGFCLVEWDNTQRTHSTVGEITIRLLHPKQVIPQNGVYGSIEEMDHIFVKLPQTREYINRKYGVTLEDIGEEEPEVRSISTASETADGLVTQYTAYYRNADGGIGKFSWVNDTVLEDMEDYQKRYIYRCSVCGAAESEAEDNPGRELYTGKGKIKRRCANCGGESFEPRAEPGEDIDGTLIKGMAPEKINLPYYTPKLYPVIKLVNISTFGQFMGESDVDKIADHQYTLNRLSKKIIDKLCKAGSLITLPPNARIDNDGEDAQIVRISDIADMQRIKEFNLQGDINADIAMYNQVYEEARQIIGITDSYQGRTDTTASSKVAKQYSAERAAGRLESKKVNKEAAWSNLYEIMFKFLLAYADEPRPVLSKNSSGGTEYTEFNKYDFLKQDAAGEYYWDDQFLFSCETSTPLAANREAMWQETRMNLQQGAFGNPAEIGTLILFWQKMEMLHYPGAGETKKYLEEQRDRQNKAQQLAAQAAQQEVDKVKNAPGTAMQEAQTNEADQQAVIEQAKSAAVKDAVKQNNQIVM